MVLQRGSYASPPLFVNMGNLLPTPKTIKFRLHAQVIVESDEHLLFTHAHFIP